MPIQTTILIVIIIAIVLQYLFGYLKNPYLGSIVPILSIILVIYLFTKGTMDLNVKNILMPIIGLSAMGFLYSDGKSKRLKKEENDAN